MYSNQIGVSIPTTLRDKDLGVHINIGQIPRSPTIPKSPVNHVTLFRTNLFVTKGEPKTVLIDTLNR